MNERLTKSGITGLAMLLVWLAGGGEVLAQTAFLQNGVTAHRGSSMEQPENTMAAFRHAIELGVDWTELDIYRSRDGQLVISHDATTGRTADRDLKIADSSWTELRALDAAFQFRKAGKLTIEQCPVTPMPLLSEILELFRGQQKTRVSIQPKSDCVDDAIALIRKMDVARWTGFNDGSLEKMSRVKELEPAIPVFWDRPPLFDLKADLETAKTRGFESLVFHHLGVTQEVIRRCHEAHIQAGAWTVNEPAKMRQFLEWEIDRIYTDDPRLLLRLKAEKAH